MKSNRILPVAGVFTALVLAGLTLWAVWSGSPAQPIPEDELPPSLTPHVATTPVVAHDVEPQAPGVATQTLPTAPDVGSASPAVAGATPQDTPSALQGDALEGKQPVQAFVRRAQSPERAELAAVFEQQTLRIFQACARDFMPPSSRLPEGDVVVRVRVSREGEGAEDLTYTTDGFWWQSAQRQALAQVAPEMSACLKRELKPFDAPRTSLAEQAFNGDTQLAMEAFYKPAVKQ